MHTHKYTDDSAVRAMRSVPCEPAARCFETRPTGTGAAAMISSSDGDSTRNNDSSNDKNSDSSSHSDNSNNSNHSSNSVALPRRLRDSPDPDPATAGPPINSMPSQ